MPVVQLANLVPVAKTTGTNRIVPGFAIPYPLGNPEMTEEQQHQMRRHRVEVCMDALTTPIEEQTVFKVKI